MAGPGRGETRHTARPRSSRSSCSCSRKSPAGSGPRLSLSLGRIRHTVEQLADFAPMEQILDDLVPLMVEHLVDVLRFFDALVPFAKQVIDVPKIILEDMTRIFREPQLAEQLVEVPTEPVFVDQTIDIPVPRGRRRRLQGFLSEQVLAQDRVQLCLTMRMRRWKGFFSHLSPSEKNARVGVFRTFSLVPKKVRGSPRTRVRSWVRTSAHPR